MGYAQLPNMRLGEVFSLAEVTPNTFQASSDYEAVAGPVSISMAMTEQTDIISEAGRPVPTDVGFHSAHVTGEVVMAFRFGADINTFLAAAMRDTALPSEVLATPAVDFIALASGSHLDGSTGAQLKVTGSNGAFDALNAASSQSDSRGALWRISDAATAGNDSATRGPVLVKTGNPRDVSADTVADLDSRLFQAVDAGPSTSWGGDWAAADTTDTITLDAGAYIGLRNSVPAGNPTYSLIVRIGDIATPQYFTLTGVTFGGPTFNFNNRGQITINFPYVAAGFTALTVTSPTSGSYNDTVNVYRRPIRGGTEITKVFLATDSATLALEGDEILSPTWGVPAAPTIMHDTIGQTGPAGYMLPAFAPVFGFTYRLKNAAAPKAVTLQTWGKAHTPVTQIIEFTDSSSPANVIYLVMREAIPASSIIPTVGSTDGAYQGVFSATAKEPSRDELAVTIHMFGG